MREVAILLMAAAAALPAQAQTRATVTVNADEATQIIPREIYGQFAEHLGTCIYGGLWVGEDSPIPNTSGYRDDVLEALRNLKVPVLRWPGGCFADEYHWTDGIGPRESRPRLVNNNWGGTVEDNSFGTHEFLNLCELIGCEPYISGNVGSGTVEELAKWVEYMTAGEGSPMAKLRAENGRQEPWKVKYLGVGNESWGCGGDMQPEYYSHLYRRYAVYCRNFGDNRLFKVASGASDYDYNWTEVLMDNVGRRMDGLSLHYYTVADWSDKGSATDFTDDQYYFTLGKCREIEDVITKHVAIMDKYDPEGRVALLVDEWGTWWDEEPGTVSGHLFQQNTMRDAIVAALTLDIFHRHTDRVKMANIAQVANVLQSMVLTSGDKMLLTPTYHVFEMYSPHQGATYLPTSVECPARDVPGGRSVPAVSATASMAGDGAVCVSLTNTDLEQEAQVTVALNGVVATTAEGRVLTAGQVAAHNTFENPDQVAPAPLDGLGVGVTKNGNTIFTVTLPPKSVSVITLR